MRADRVFGAAALLLYCALSACHIENRPPPEQESGGSPAENGGGQAGQSARGGGSAGGHGGARSSATPTAEEAGAAGEAGFVAGGAGASDGRDSGAAGSDGETDASSTLDSGPPTEIMPNCDADAGCRPVPACPSGKVTCSVVPFDVYCELSLAAGHSASIACGEAATVDTETCGGCGRVAVEVYYDGKYCWQGIPQCSIEGVAGKFVAPHPPDPG